MEQGEEFHRLYRNAIFGKLTVAEVQIDGQPTDLVHPCHRNPKYMCQGDLRRQNLPKDHKQELYTNEVNSVSINWEEPVCYDRLYIQ